MKLIERYKSQLPHKGDDLIGGYNWIDNVVIDKLIHNVRVLNFDMPFYTKLILQFHKEGLIDIGTKDADRIENYLNNIKVLKNDVPMRTFINSYFGRLKDIDKNKITQYTWLMYNEILQINENILYIDTDMIFFTGDNINMFDINIPYSIDTKFDYLIMNGKKRYVAYDSQARCKQEGLQNPGFITRGFNSVGKGRNINKSEEYISTIKQVMRSDKLDLILN